MEPDPKAPVTLKTIRRMVRDGEPFACLTCYDATTARWLERAGIHLLLVGDSAAEVVLGLPSTVHMPLDVLLALTAAVKRGAPGTLVMGDMPFMSYHASPDDAMKNAGRFLTEGMADIVKLEVDASMAPLVERMTKAGIPVCGHIGYRPQTVGLIGGHASAGRTPFDAERIIRDALTLEEAGCVMLLVEAVPPEVGMKLVEQTNVPLIGIGAGPAPHGQIIVLQDLLGLTDRQPPFAQAVVSLGPKVQEAADQWRQRVSRREVTQHAYSMRPATEVTMKRPSPTA